MIQASLICNRRQRLAARAVVNRSNLESPRETIQLHLVATTTSTTNHPRFLFTPKHNNSHNPQLKMDRLNRMLASAGGMGGLNSAAPGSVGTFLCSLAELKSSLEGP